MRASIHDLFSTEYGSMIIEHKNRIINILGQYDVAIFMARKSICLLSALVENGEIKIESSCRILSSRALSYNCLESLKGKKVAIIDDVVVFGKTIMNVMKRLENCDIDADVYIMACEKDFFDGISFKGSIKEGCQYYEAAEIHQISDQITEYIICSGISYNVDQPIFHISFASEEDIDSRLYNNHKTTLLSDGLQTKYGIENFTIHFKTTIADTSDLNSIINGSPLIKIRFIREMDKNVIRAIPFVFLPEMTYAEVERAYDLFFGNKYDSWILCSDKGYELKNKQKLLHYVISEMLFYQFAKANSFEKYIKDTLVESSLFPFEIESFNKTKNCFNNCELDFKNEVACIEDQYLFDQVLSAAYEFLSCRGSNEFESEQIKPITFSTFKQYIFNSVENTDEYMISSATDVLIDKGILVPYIFVDVEKKTIERGFRFGEIFKLTEDSMNLFQVMLRQYQSIKNADLDRMEFEKLCVIFLRKVGYTGKGILSAAKEYGEDNFSICYTRFGPRISSSNSRIDVPAYSSFARRMLDEKRMVNTTGRKYRVKEISVSFPEGWDVRAYNFAKSYAELGKCFGGPGSIHNKYIRSYNDFLTILAIGRKNEDRLYSLVAELKLFDRINTEGDIVGILYDMHHFAEESTESGYRGIMDGIGSGMWKYTCFCQDNLVSGIFKDAYTIRKDDSARYLQEDYLSETVDTNPNYKEIIDRTAELLYKVGLCFEVAYKRFVDSDCKSIFRDIIYEQDLSKRVLDGISNLKTENDYVIAFQDMQLQVRKIIDETNMISESHSYWPEKRFQNCFVFSDDDSKPAQKDDKKFSSGESKNWIVSPKSKEAFEEDQVKELRERYRLDGNKRIFFLDFGKEYLGFSQNGSKIAGTNAAKFLNDIADAEDYNLTINNITIHIYEGGACYNVSEMTMGDNYSIHNDGIIGANVSGHNNQVEQTLDYQINHNEVYRAIEQTKLNSDVFSSSLIEKFEEIKNDCKEQTDDEEKKYKGILSKLSDFVGKISLETAKTVLPTLVIQALAGGGLLPG